MKILAINDKESQLADLSEMLRSLIPGCKTLTASSGEIGLEMVLTCQPDTIILDIEMPGMDGFQVCQTLKDHPATRHIPVIFLTGHATDSASRIRGLEIGGDAFLTHPVEAGELISQVRAMVRIKHAEDALRAEKRAVDSMLRDVKELQAAILQTARDAFFIFDAQGRFLEVNEAACQMTGFSREELLQITISDLEADDTPSEITAQVQKIKQTGAALFERRHRCKNGRLIHVELSVNYLPKFDGRLFAFARDITNRRQAEAAFRLKNAALEATANSVVITDREGKIEWTNAAFTTFTGYSAQNAVGKNPSLLKSGRHDAAFYKNLWDTILAGKVWQGEIINKRKDGSLYHEDTTITPLKDERGEVTHFIAVKQDITQRKLLEEQFRQSQKMEAFGQLAGGVAHDFNNILTIILGNAALLQADNLSPVDKDQLLEQIIGSSNRAAGLVSQLLAFSRRQIMQARPVDLNNVVADMGRMLQRLIGENIFLQTRLLPSVAPAKADPGMIEQVLLNLVVNARDAMPKGGQLAIMLEKLTLDGTAALRPPARPGDFIRLSVQDSGRGISPEVLPHIFEPFFTTKDVGKGTGLGLATVHGIVAQHRGWIEVVSQLNQGTTFHVYLPRLTDAQQVQTAESSISPVRGGTETLLLVEDDPALRTLLTHTLKNYGYHVIEADSGLAALEMWRQHRLTVDLLLTDIIMPDGVSGSELAVQLQADKPGLKVLYMSGHPGEVAGRGVDLHEGVNFLQKPFAPAKLGLTVRDCLDAAQN